MAGTLTINTGTDSNGNNSIICDLKDENGNITDTTVFSANDSANNYQKTSIKGTVNTSDSITAYRSGKTVVIKGIDVSDFPFGNTIKDTDGNYLYNNSTSGFCDTGFTVPTAFLSTQKEYFYRNSPIWATDGGNVYFISFVINTNGKIGARMERSTTFTGAAAKNTWNNVNFTLVYVVP